MRLLEHYEQMQYLIGDIETVAEARYICKNTGLFQGEKDIQIIREQILDKNEDWQKLKEAFGFSEEFIRDNERLEEMCWPRFAASAEVGWCGSNRPGYVDFCRRLEVLFPLFEKYGIHATGKDGWIPDEETAAEQTEAFQRNFSKEDLEEARRMQEEI